MKKLLESIPVTFISDKFTLNWSEVLWGYERQLIGWRVPVQLAENIVLKDSGNCLELELAGLDKENAGRVGEILRELKASDGEFNSERAKRKWLYLLLAWIFKNRKNYPDPLGIVEEIYADFDYPEEVSQFVRYMPTTDGYDPKSHTTEDNKHRLYNKWQEYLNQ